MGDCLLAETRAIILVGRNPAVGVARGGEDGVRIALEGWYDQLVCAEEPIACMKRVLANYDKVVGAKRNNDRSTIPYQTGWSDTPERRQGRS